MKQQRLVELSLAGVFADTGLEHIENLYDEVLKRGIEHDNHESDLYLPVTRQTTALVMQYVHRCNVTTFRSRLPGGGLWYDVPFAYLPWWEKREAAR